MTISDERDNNVSTQPDAEVEMSTAREVLPRVGIAPRVIETIIGKVEFDLTEG